MGKCLWVLRVNDDEWSDLFMPSAVFFHFPPQHHHAVLQGASSFVVQ